MKMADSAATIQFEHKGIGRAIAHNRFVVPLNQREYSWEEEHVTDLFQDFSNAIAVGNSSATYFLGTVVLTTSADGNPEVCDGQQRLATTTILIAAIRDYFHSRKDTKRVSSLEHDYLFSTDVATTETVPRLSLNVDDNEFFRSYVLATPGTPDRSAVPTKDSHRKIVRATELAAEHVQNIISQHKKENRVNVLLSWTAHH
jgi:hypothetical protein